MIRTHIGLPPLLPPLSSPPPSPPLSSPLPPPPPPPHPISTDASGMHRQSFADVHQCIAEVLPMYHRPSQRTISNCHRMFGEH